MPSEANVVIANAVTVGGFAFTLTSIDAIISIAVGCVALIAGAYSVVWHHIRIRAARAKRNE